MKQFFLASAAALSALGLAAASVPASAADVGVSINVGEPGFFGRIDIGNVPQPRLMYRRPVVIETAPVAREPVYLHVPPGHAKNWRKYCHQYDACGRPVYFVEDHWYNEVYVPRYREFHRRDHDRRDSRDDHDRDHDRRHDDDHDGHGDEGRHDRHRD